MTNIRGSNPLEIPASLTSSKSRPPRQRSHSEALITSFPVVKAAIVTVKLDWPKSRNMTELGFAASNWPLADLNIPYSKATAVPSCSKRRQWSWAMSQAWSIEARWESV